jgi:hypothetical protein
MRADGDGAMRMGAAQGEVGAGSDVGLGPGGVAVGHHALDGAGEVAGGVGAARPDMALVEMGVAVHQAGPELPAMHGEGPSVPVPMGAMAAMRPSSTRRSSRSRSCASAAPGAPSTSEAGTRASRSQ